MATALVGKNKDAAAHIMTMALESVGNDLIAVANSYDRSDLPFVVASLRLMAEALSGMMNDSGRIIADSIVSNTMTCGVDGAALREALGHGRTEE